MNESGEKLVRKIKPVQAKIEVEERGDQKPWRKSQKKTVEKKGIMAELVEVSKEDEQLEGLRLYYERTGDETALYVHVEGLIDKLAAGAKKNLALRQEEVEKILKVIALCPGEGVSLKSELGRHVWEMMNKLQEDKYTTVPRQNQATAAWDALGKETLLEKGAIKVGFIAKQQIRSDAKQAAENHPELAEIYYYGIEHGKEPQKFHWTDAMELKKQQEAVENNQADRDAVLYELAAKARHPTTALARLKAKTWKDHDTRLRAWEKIEGKLMEDFAVNPQEYWRGQLLVAVEKRLKNMRSGAKARLTLGKGAKAKFAIGAPKRWEDLKDWRGFSPKLAVAEVSGNTVIGQFLDSMGRGRFWMGKAMLDYGYWRLAKGYLVEHKGEGERSAQGDVLSHIDERLLSDDVREHTGAGAMDLIARDKRTMRVLNELFLLPMTLEKDTSTHFESILKDLGDDMGFDHTKDLPDFVTDAVMIATGFYNFDVENMPSSDKRHQIFHFAKFYMKKYITDSLGRNVESLLGEGFRLVETEIAKVGFSVGRNRGFDYHAFVDDIRKWDPEEFPDQLDKNWQYVYFFMLQRRERDLRRMREPGDQANFPVTPGTTAQFMPYDNERVKGGEHDHRKAVYKRVKDVLGEHDKLMLENGEGKVGYNKDDLRDRVIQVLNEFEGAATYRIGGVDYTKAEKEIFWNEAVEEMIERRRLGGIAALSPAEAMKIDSFLNLRKVLQDARAWGLIYAFDDPEVREFSEDGKDIVYGLSYMVGANESRAKMLKLLNAAPYQTPEEMTINPALVLDTLLNLKGRFNPEMTFRNSYLLYAYAENVVIRRMLQLEIPSVQALTQMMDSTGETQLSWWRLGWFSAGWWGKEEALARQGYMEKMLKVRLEMTQTGLLDRFDDFMDMWRQTLMAAEAFGWEHTRSMWAEQRAYIYKYLAGWNNPFQPVESWRVVDAVKQTDGSYKQTGTPAAPGNWIQNGLRVQDLTKKEIKAFFEEIDFQEAGQQLFGGQTVGPTPRDLRAGETMFEGGRFVWDVGNNEWKWDEGEWAYDQSVERMRFFEKGEEMKRDDGTKILADDGKTQKLAKGFSREKLILDDRGYRKKGGKLKKKNKGKMEVVYPFYAFKNEKARQDFYKHRYDIIFRLTTGRPIGYTKGGDAMIKLDKYYKTTKGATIYELIRQVGALKSESVYQVNRIRQARQMEVGGLQYKYDLGKHLEKAIKALVTGETGKSEGNLLKHDVKRLYEWRRAYNRKYRDAIQGTAVRWIMAFTQWGVELGPLKVTPAVILGTTALLGLTSSLGLAKFFGSIPYVLTSPEFIAQFANESLPVMLHWFSAVWNSWKAGGGAQVFASLTPEALGFGTTLNYVVSYLVSLFGVDAGVGKWLADKMPQDEGMVVNYDMLKGHDPDGWDDHFPVL